MMSTKKKDRRGRSVRSTRDGGGGRREAAASGLLQSWGCALG